MIDTPAPSSGEPDKKRQKTKSNTLPPFHSDYYPQGKRRKVFEKYSVPDNKPYNIFHRLQEHAQQKQKLIIDSLDSENNVAHMFFRDFRILDNRSLSKSSLLAKSKGCKLITFWVFCLESIKAHSSSAFQLNYQLENLRLLKEKLHKNNIALYIIKTKSRKTIAKDVLKFAELKKIKVISTNLQYEIDELNMSIDLLKTLGKNDIAFIGYDDSCLIKPGVIVTQKGEPFKAFGKWYDAFIKYLKDSKKAKGEDDPYFDYKLAEDVEGEDVEGEEGKGDDIPSVPSDFKLNKEQRGHFDKLKIGEDHAIDALNKFIESGKIKNYKEDKDIIERNGTSRISMYITNGNICLRTIFRTLIDHKVIERSMSLKNKTSEYVRQLSWKDFYSHVMAEFPYVGAYVYHTGPCETEDFEWVNDKNQFEAWCSGNTGYPIIDASMREMNATGYMQNRNRMLVASFLTKNLLIDWRYGERYFMERLVDGDTASNNGGWGFIAGVGIPGQPWFRIMNPYTQSKKNDAAKYIKHWVPELTDVEDNDIYDYVSEDNKEYPEPIIDYSESRERALEWYDKMKHK